MRGIQLDKVGRRLGASLLMAGLLLAACSSKSPGATGTSAGSSSPASTSTKPGAGPVRGALLTAAANGDGDSWKDTAGREYRLGLVNTPEHNECYGSQATAARKRQVAAGFRAQVYSTDRYGRSVSVVTTSDGTNLNVWLARNGFANDRYLAEFRSENPALAVALDAAFAAARREGKGLWKACRPPG